jgi:multidrug efflux pump subunit AcrA (membrane-fusion protein)
VVSIIIIACAVAAFLFLGTKPVVPKLKIQKKGISVDAIKVKKIDTVVKMDLWGEVRNRRNISVKAEVEGIVVKVNSHLRPGFKVNKGDVLLNLDTERIQQRLLQEISLEIASQASLQELTIELSNLQKELKLSAASVGLVKEDLARHETLEKANNTSKLTLSSFRQALIRSQVSHQQLASRFNLLPAKIKAAKAHVKNIQAAISLLKRDISDSAVKAPFSGVIHGDVVSAGDYLKKGDSVCRLIDPLWHEVWVNVGSVEKKKLGTVRSILFSGVTQKDFRFSGVLEKEIQSEALIFEIKGREMKAGELVEVEVIGKELKEIIRLPESALRHDGESVYLIVDGKLKVQTISCEMITEGYAYCVAGLDVGDEVVITRLRDLGEGSAVLVSGREK